MVDIPILLILAIVFLIIGGGIMGVVMLRAAVLSRLNPPMEDQQDSPLPQTRMAPEVEAQPNLKLDLSFKTPTSVPPQSPVSNPVSTPSATTPETPTAPVARASPPLGQIQTKQTA